MTDLHAEIVRDRFRTVSTLGSFSLLGLSDTVKFSCFSLEDCYRGQIKIPHETCIPEGDYWIAVTMSARFKRLLPVIFNQPDYTIKTPEGIV